MEATDSGSDRNASLRKKIALEKRDLVKQAREAEHFPVPEPTHALKRRVQLTDEKKLLLEMALLAPTSQIAKFWETAVECQSKDDVYDLLIRNNEEILSPILSTCTGCKREQFCELMATFDSKLKNLRKEGLERYDEMVKFLNLSARFLAEIQLTFELFADYEQRGCQITKRECRSVSFMTKTYNSLVNNYQHRWDGDLRRRIYNFDRLVPYVDIFEFLRSKGLSENVITVIIGFVLNEENV